MKTVFESENIKYIEVTKQLLNEYMKMVNDVERVGRLIGRTKTITEEKERRWIREKRESCAPVFSMIEKNSGEFIGNIEFMNVHDSEGELGIAITADKQDLGYGSEAITAFVEYGMTALGLKRIVLSVFPDNYRAIHVYKKCGFTEYARDEKDIFMVYSGSTSYDVFPD